MNIFAPVDLGPVKHYKVVRAFMETKSGREYRVWDLVAVYAEGRTEVVERYNTRRDAITEMLRANREIGEQK